jgi:hypothetical protein
MFKIFKVKELRVKNKNPTKTKENEKMVETLTC